MTLDFAQVVAFGAIRHGTAAGTIDTMTDDELADSGGALGSNDVTKAIIMSGDDGDDDPDKKPWQGIYAEF